MNLKDLIDKIKKTLERFREQSLGNPVWEPVPVPVKSGKKPRTSR